MRNKKLQSLLIVGGALIGQSIGDLSIYRLIPLIIVIWHVRLYGLGSLQKVKQFETGDSTANGWTGAA